MKWNSAEMVLLPVGAALGYLLGETPIAWRLGLSVVVILLGALALPREFEYLRDVREMLIKNDMADLATRIYRHLKRAVVFILLGAIFAVAHFVTSKELLGSNPSTASSEMVIVQKLMSAGALAFLSSGYWIAGCAYYASLISRALVRPSSEKKP